MNTLTQRSARALRLISIYLALDFVLSHPQSGEAAVWVESWQKTALGDYSNTDSFENGFFGDAGGWIVDDHIDECGGVGPHPVTARIAAEGANHVLKLIVPENTCTSDLSLEFYGSPNIPITSATRLAITESGTLASPQWNGFFPTVFPPPGDHVHLALQDQKGNLLIYLFQRAPNYLSHTESLDAQFQDGSIGKIGYREVFLDAADSAGGSYVSKLFDDFSKVPGFNAVGAQITAIGLSVSGVGMASFDELKIGDNLPVVLPSIAAQPERISVSEGAVAAFSVTANGTKPLSYQWQKNGGDLPSQNEATLNLTSVRLTDAGEYRVNVSNAGGSVFSQAAVLTVQPSASPPEVTVQPQNQTADQGGNATFSAGATGTLPLSYQWQMDGTNIVGATSAILVVTNAQSRNVGDYSVVVSNAAATVLSASAALALRLAGGLFTQGRILKWRESLDNTKEIGDGTSHVTLSWSVASSEGLGWFYGSSETGDSDVAYAVGVSDVWQIVCIGGLSFTAHSVGQYGVGSFLVWRNGSTGHTGVFRIDDLPDGNPLSGTWWFRSDGGTDFSELGPVAEPLVLSNLKRIESQFSFKVPSAAGCTYVVEYQDALSGKLWLPLLTLTGTGEDVVITDPSSTTVQRFYRVNRSP